MIDHLITEEEYVVCRICLKSLQKIDGRHLKYHNIKLDEYREKYPNDPTVTKKKFDDEKEKNKKAGNKSKEKVNQIKTIKCIHCSKVLEVPNNYSNIQACKSCLDLGYENPDGRSKPQANERRIDTNLKRHGVSNVKQVKEFNDKATQTSIEKGGVGFANEESNNKVKKYLIENFGVDNIMKTQEMREHFSKPRSEETKKKISESRKGKPSKLKGRNYEETMGEEKAKEVKDLKRKKALGQYHDDVMNRVEEMNLELLDENYKGIKYDHNFRCKICGNEFSCKYSILKRRKILCNNCMNENPKQIK